MLLVIIPFAGPEAGEAAPAHPSRTWSEAQLMSVKLEREGGVGVIVLDRPPVNSYDYQFLQQLGSTLDEARWDDEVRAVVVTSASEKFFSAGADVTAFQASSPRQRAMTALLAHETFRKM